MSQQHMPDDRALREELSSQQAGRRRPNDRLRGESAEDEGLPPSRRRSGSLASSASHASSFIRPGGNDSGNELSDYYPGGLPYGSGRVSALSRRSVDPRTEVDLDYQPTERLRRGGSLARGTYNNLSNNIAILFK